MKKVLLGVAIVFQGLLNLTFIKAEYHFNDKHHKNNEKFNERKYRYVGQEAVEHFAIAGDGENCDLSLQDLRAIIKNLNDSWKIINFEGANLAGANLARANLTKVDFSDAVLTAAYLQDAILYKANFTRANLTDANFEEADL